MKRVRADPCAPDRRRRLLYALRGPLIDGAFGPHAASLFGMIQRRVSREVTRITSG
jgi:hypothetical protein